MGRPAKAVKYDGVWWPTRKSLAAHAGVSESAVGSAVWKHGDDLDAAGHRFKQVSGRRIELWYEGERFACCSQLACHLGVSTWKVSVVVAAFGVHLKAEHFKAPRVVIHPPTWFIYKGVRYKGEKEILKRFGLSPGEARRLTEEHGHDLDAAGIELPELAPRIPVSALKLTPAEKRMWGD